MSENANVLRGIKYVLDPLPAIADHIEGVEDELSRLVSFAATCKTHNIDDWMFALAFRINAANKALGDGDRLVYENGELAIRKMTRLRD